MNMYFRKGTTLLPFDVLQTALGYRFTDEALLRAALTHSSWVNEGAEGADAATHNERLEFLGDAVLELCVSGALYARFPGVREGELTRMRSSLVNARVLAQIARQCGADVALRLGRGEESQGGRQRDALLADALEALIGAVFLDGGYASARVLIARLYDGRWPGQTAPVRHKDPKTRLQEVTQHLWQALPVYTLHSSNGPEHAPLFQVLLRLPDGQEFAGEGGSMKRAEQATAQKALEEIETRHCEGV